MVLQVSSLPKARNGFNPGPSVRDWVRTIGAWGQNNAVEVNPNQNLAARHLRHHH
ncbi:hypothetical protein EYZ11_012954 [Aspergillus tanneri]|uniref:Uncharacterized protein n=1 Tax=Aspergillus tanneri TaxID=1220188 RepID=A0A4S3J4A7_9EURO|nr:hypothetical protein EYZ11_012954 [Aspergillus tanneri]